MNIRHAVRPPEVRVTWGSAGARHSDGQDAYLGEQRVANVCFASAGPLWFMVIDLPGAMGDIEKRVLPSYPTCERAMQEVEVRVAMWCDAAGLVPCARDVALQSASVSKKVKAKIRRKPPVSRG